MAKKSAIERQKKRERLVKLKWDKRISLRQQSKDVKLTEEERENARVQLNMLPRNSAPARLRNRCSLTGRPRAYIRKFGLSRICFREMAHKGLLPGVTKASW